MANITFFDTFCSYKYLDFKKKTGIIRIRSG